MPNLMASPTNFPRRINNYVPAMQYSSEVNYNGNTRVNFGASPAALATQVISAASIAVAGNVDLSTAAAFPDQWGRNLTLVASGASTATVIVYGWDYLGQPIAEQFTLNGVTPVVGVKAFKSFNYLNNTASPVTVNVGSGAKLGLPYKTLRVQFEIANGVVVASGTFIAPSLVDPQTNVTPDPRGMYTPTTTLNGANIISGVFDMANDVNTSNRGGLHGLQQAAA